MQSVFSTIPETSCVIAPTTPNCSLDIGTCTVNGHVIVCCCDVDLANIAPDVIVDDGSTLMLCYVMLICRSVMRCKNLHANIVDQIMLLNVNTERFVIKV